MVIPKKIPILYRGNLEGEGEPFSDNNKTCTPVLLSISFPEHARSQVKGGHSSGEIELIHVGFPT
jgi:hypothetical protein